MTSGDMTFGSQDTWGKDTICPYATFQLSPEQQQQQQQQLMLQQQQQQQQQQQVRLFELLSLSTKTC